ncbi:MAG: UDP-N-acetylenolpyruvoylglucosamine reductase, partial [Rikenellaceae bacterium]|nr:UDP-N-acetylenolpyruvoylglucosamine reductase [Rikenellaceae bacterium]
MLTIQHNQELKELNTFGISAKAAGFAEFRNKYDLDFLFSDPQWSGRPWYVIGGGSNILLSGNYPGLLLHP